MAVPLVCSMVPLSSVRTQLPPILIVADVPIPVSFPDLVPELSFMVRLCVPLPDATENILVLSVFPARSIVHFHGFMIS